MTAPTKVPHRWKSEGKTLWVAFEVDADLLEVEGQLRDIPSYDVRTLRLDSEGLDPGDLADALPGEGIYQYRFEFPSSELRAAYLRSMNLPDTSE